MPGADISETLEKLLRKDHCFPLKSQHTTSKHGALAQAPGAGEGHREVFRR